MYDAAKALAEAMMELGLACDGGKDSLSMAASVEGEVDRCLDCLATVTHNGQHSLSTMCSQQHCMEERSEQFDQLLLQMEADLALSTSRFCMGQLHHCFEVQISCAD